jgi:hypothetical protein
MDFETVKVCFEKYINFMKESTNIKISEPYDLDSITIQKIDKITQIVFMDYVLESKSPISQNSISCVIYKHLDSLIRKYMRDDLEKTNKLLKEHIMELEAKLNGDNPTEPQKGWFF